MEFVEETNVVGDIIRELRTENGNLKLKLGHETKAKRRKLTNVK